MKKVMKDLDYYAELLSKVSRGRDTHNKPKEPSPYKPIFLLSVIELIEKGQISENKITVESDFSKLENIFIQYQALFGEAYKNKKSVLCQPFFNLINEKCDKTGEGFWHLIKNSKTIDIKDIRDAEGRNRIKSEAKLREHVRYEKFDDELFRFFQDSESRDYLVNVIFDTFFSEIKNQVEDIIKIVDRGYHELSQISEPKDTEPKFVTRQSIVRKSLFRKSIIHIYDYQCAICRLKVNILGSRYKAIIDAAHIKPLSEVYNNRLSNGIALCKNHHWAFDNGCFGIDKVKDNYFIIVSEHFEEECLSTLQDLKMIPLKAYHQQKIFLPDHMPKEYHPNHDALSWHLEKHCINCVK